MAETYEIVLNDTAIRCLLCGRTSYNANDVAERYCANCCVFHDDLATVHRLVTAGDVPAADVDFFTRLFGPHPAGALEAGHHSCAVESEL